MLEVLRTDGILRAGLLCLFPAFGNCNSIKKLSGCSDYSCIALN